MALSDDQRALLRLLARREEGYEDIAALKGMSVEEVRNEVRSALEELDAPPEPVEPPPPEPPPPPPEPSPPPAPEPSARAAETAPVPKARAASPRLPGVPPERRRLLALAAAAVGVVAIVLVAAAVFGDDSGSSTASSGGSEGELASAEGDGGLTQAKLEPVDGSDASGQAIFGRVGKEEVVLQVTAENLEPAQGANSYTVWLYRSPTLALRVGSVKVSNSGRLGSRFPIPAELLAYVASGAFKQIKISRTSDAAYEAAVRRSRKQKTLPPYSGKTVLSGKITGPIVRQGAGQG